MDIDWQAGRTGWRRPRSCCASSRRRATTTTTMMRRRRAGPGPPGLACVPQCNTCCPSLAISQLTSQARGRHRAADGALHCGGGADATVPPSPVRGEVRPWPRSAGDGRERCGGEPPCACGRPRPRTPHAHAPVASTAGSVAGRAPPAEPRSAPSRSR
eukprot:scaffold539_cov359-Prasinococcus_capsulatus_cf.AAC.6